MSFPRKHRLINKEDFKSIFDKAKKVNQRYLTLLHKPNQTEHARLGLVVGKRVANSAVKRNRIKRVIRESFRHYQTNLTGIDIIVIARQQCDKLTKQKLREGIDQLWEKLKLSC